jgi:integrase/recombinase XerD
MMENHRADYLEHLKALGRAPGTVVYMDYYLGVFLAYLHRRSLEPETVTPPVLEDYRREVYEAKRKRGGGPLAPSTIFMRLWAVKSYYGFLAERRHILMNPAAGMDLPSPSGRPPKVLFNEHQIRAVIEKPDLETPIGVRDRAMLEVLYSTGIRRQELVNLNVTDVDLSQGVLRVNKGKGRKDRVVPIGQTACRFLELYLRTVRGQSLNILLRGKVFGGTEPALFLGQYGGRMSAALVNYIIRSYVRAAFPGIKFSCHGFRHACATHMLRGGADIRLVQEMLGHKHLESTEVYTHLAPIDLKEVHRQSHPRGRQAKP